MTFGRSVATVGGLTMVSRVLGFVRDVLSAALLGAGPVADAAFVAFRLPNLFRRLFAEGAFSVAFVPLFSGALEEHGQEKAADFAEQAQAVMLLVLMPLTILAMVFMPEIMIVLAPGFRPGTDRYDLAVTLSRITFPYLILISLSALQGGVLNALDKYWAFAAAPILFNLCLILGFALTPWMPTAGHSLAWGEALAGVVQFLWMMRACRLSGIHLRLRRPKFTPEIRRLFALMGPAALGGGAAQLNAYIDTVIASILPSGSISYLYYADRLNQLPLGVIGIAVSTALLPILSRHAKAGRIAELRAATSRAVEISLLLALPAAVALVAASRPIMEALFAHGKFTEDNAATAALGLSAYSLGIPAYILSKILSVGFFARQDTKTPVRYSIITICANTAMSLSLIHWLGFIGIALATGVTAWLNVGLLVRHMRREGMLTLDQRLRFALPRLIIAAAAMAAALFGIDLLFAGWWTGPVIQRGIALAVLVGGGAVVYLSVAALFGVLTKEEVRMLMRRKRKEQAE
jgi:putative peptidoglycan lipid II flippase